MWLDEAPGRVMSVSLVVRPACGAQRSASKLAKTAVATRGGACRRDRSMPCGITSGDGGTDRAPRVTTATPDRAAALAIGAPIARARPPSLKVMPHATTVDSGAVRSGFAALRLRGRHARRCARPPFEPAPQ